MAGSYRPPGTGERTAKQVWFPGSHSDVGGGYPEAQLSDVALEWMLAEAIEVEDGLRLWPGHGVVLAPDACGPIHDPGASGLARLYRRQVRSWPAGWGGPVIHQSALDRAAWSGGLEHGPVYRPWILRDFRDRCRVEPNLQLRTLAAGPRKTLCHFLWHQAKLRRQKCDCISHDGSQPLQKAVVTVASAVFKYIPVRPTDIGQFAR